MLALWVADFVANVLRVASKHDESSPERSAVDVGDVQPEADVVGPEGAVEGVVLLEDL